MNESSNKEQEIKQNNQINLEEKKAEDINDINIEDYIVKDFKPFNNQEKYLDGQQDNKNRENDNKNQEQLQSVNQDQKLDKKAADKLEKEQKQILEKKEQEKRVKRIQSKYQEKEGLLEFDIQDATLGTYLLCLKRPMSAHSMVPFVLNPNNPNEIKTQIKKFSFIFYQKAPKDQQKLYKELIQHCKKSSIDFKENISQSLIQFRDLIKKFTFTQKEDIFTICGGNNSFYYALNQIIELQNTQDPNNPILLSLLPFGTTNNFAKALDLTPQNLLKRIDLLWKCPQLKKIDIVKATFVDGIGQTKTRYFHSHCGYGFSQQLLSVVKQNFKCFLSLKLKLMSIKPAYSIENSILTVIVDNQIILQNYSVKFILIQNTQYQGEGFRVAPCAQIDDGLMDIIIILTNNQDEFINIFKALFSNGMHIYQKQCLYYRGKNIKILCQKVNKLEIDGQQLLAKELECQVENHNIHMLC